MTRDTNATPHAQEHFAVRETTSWKGVLAKSVPDMFRLELRSPGASMNAAVLTGPALGKLTNEAESPHEP